MSDSKNTDSSNPYSIDFDVTSPSGIEWARGLLSQLSESEGVFRVAIEIESNEPLNPEDILNQSPSSTEVTSQAATPQVTEPQSERDSQKNSNESEPVTEESEDEEEGVECEYCGDTFHNERSRAGHLRWCEERPTEDEESNSEQTIKDDYDLSAGTVPYRIASTLLHIDEEPTPSDMEALLDGTEWESNKGRLSTVLGDLYRDAIVDRDQKELDSPGQNPYQYWLNEDGVKITQQAEENASDEGIKTYEDITDSDEEEGEHECETCGETFETKKGLGSHRYHKHPDDNEDEDTANSQKASQIELKPGTQRYRVASALSLTNEPIVPRELEELLEDSDWESSRSNISADLGNLHSAGIVERETREERGQPFEYVLTEEGREHVNKAILNANENNEETVNEIVQSMLNEGETSEDSEETPSGLDVLFNEESNASETEGFNQFDEQETDPSRTEEPIEGSLSEN